MTNAHTLKLKDIAGKDPGVIRVLDQGFIQLVDYMPSDYPFGQVVEGATAGDIAIVAAARVSYGTVTKGTDADRKLIEFLLRHGHTSPLEMVEFKFIVKAPVVMWWQHVRHRIQEMNFQSGRYTPYPENEFYLPEKLRAQDKVNKQGSVLVDFLSSDEERALLEELRAHYEAGFSLYKKMLAKGVAKEMARLALPGWALYHTAYVKMNAHALMHYLAKRTEPDAQYEIRVYAQAMERIFAEKLPWVHDTWRNSRGAAM
ncbi:FAD-dependent thymidylate synthase [Gloeobacter violaceus]|uniref:Flavin-dependent thymidylate synthase n=1 Tax=Gloeobacter violaceus (strain ATCC 29082 / PCC 7421) TaxID=251221 RepID=Q7NI62_GLOVI|nr:FAD-dependent thymidylate synthase [Gloeobacter violaceus]BAC90262.1 glr2321 [Gloeobacter violaceus PCC 7421]